MATSPLRRSAAEENVAAENPHAVTARGRARARCVLFAYHEMGYACMEALLAMGAPIAALFTHQDDSHEEIWWRSCADLARSHGVPVYTPERLDESGSSGSPPCARRSSIRFTTATCCPMRLLRTAPLGAYNLHGSLLPAYRGRAPVNWMLVNGEREAGVTLHHMVARADAGDIVAPARGRDRRQRHGAYAVPQAGAARRRADHRDASADRRRARAAPRAGSFARQLLRTAPPRGRANRLAMARAAHLQPRARRDPSLSGRVLLA